MLKITWKKWAHVRCCCCDKMTDVICERLTAHENATNNRKQKINKTCRLIRKKVEAFLFIAYKYLWSKQCIVLQYLVVKIAINSVPFSQVFLRTFLFWCIIHEDFSLNVLKCTMLKCNFRTLQWNFWHYTKFTISSQT